MRGGLQAVPADDVGQVGGALVGAQENLRDGVLHARAARVGEGTLELLQDLGIGNPQSRQGIQRAHLRRRARHVGHGAGDRPQLRPVLHRPVAQVGAGDPDVALVGARERPQGPGSAFLVSQAGERGGVAHRIRRRAAQASGGAVERAVRIDPAGEVDFLEPDSPRPDQLGSERNPFLGLRGLRLSLARPDVFAVQVSGAEPPADGGDAEAGAGL